MPNYLYKVTWEFNPGTSASNPGVVYYTPEQISALNQVFFPEKKPEIPPEPEEQGMFANKYLIGCDPEFVIIDPKTRYIVHVPEDFPNAMLGYDHGGRVVELRPHAYRSAFMVLKGLRQLLQRHELDKLHVYRWKAGARYSPPGGDMEALGGHIHLDVPYNNREVINALDLMTQRLEYLDILPTVECNARRRGSAYGRLGDVRPAGRTHHLEYRTPPSWLFSPRTSYFCLAAYKLAAISPEVTFDYLIDEGSAKALVRFFSAFKGKDRDADRLLERHLENHGLKDVRGDPDADIKETWRLDDATSNADNE